MVWFDSVSPGCPGSDDNLIEGSNGIGIMKNDEIAYFVILIIWQYIGIDIGYYFLILILYQLYLIDQTQRVKICREAIPQRVKIYREAIHQRVKMYVWQRDGGKCVYCGSNRNLEYDHIISVAKGGSNTERNIQLLCQDCNRSKGVNI